MYKIAVIGDRDSVLGFRALGLDVFPTEDTDAERRTLHRLAQEDYAVIYITEQLARLIGMPDHARTDSTTLTPSISSSWRSS